MQTATRNTTIWWILGAIVVLGLILFFAFRNNNPRIPNTGVDDGSTSANDSQIIDDSYLNNSSSSRMMEEAKG